MKTMMKIWVVIFTISIVSCSERNKSQNISQAKKEVTLVKVLETYTTKNTSTKMVTDSVKKENLTKITKTIKKNDTIVSKNKPIEFTIDPKTGEVHGCPHLEFLGEYDYEMYSQKRDYQIKYLDSIRPQLRSIIMNEEEELWFGAPENTGQSRHDGFGPLWMDVTDDGERFIIPVGYPHGGYCKEVYFFDKDFNLINKQVLDNGLSAPQMRLNAEQTFYIADSSVGGDFYFFTRDGVLYKKGNYKTITGNTHTSFGRNTISESGEYWQLSNDVSYLMHKDSIYLEKSDISFSCIVEKSSIYAFLGYYINSDRVTYSKGFGILSLKNKSVKYVIKEKDTKFLNIQGNTLMVRSSISNKKYIYKIK